METRFASIVPLQHRKAAFSSFYPRRSNGWGHHRLIFSSNVETIAGEGKLAHDVFRYDQDTGRIEVNKAGYILRIEFWWKGRAPWGYHNTTIVRNLQCTGEEMNIPKEEACGLSGDECKLQHSRVGECGHRCCHETGIWASNNGHVRAWVTTRTGDTFSVLNVPAHIQGTPGCFELRVSAYRESDALAVPTSDARGLGGDEALAQLVALIGRETPSLATAQEVHALLASTSHAITYQSTASGSTALEVLRGMEGKLAGDPDLLHQLRTLVCVNAYSHSKLPAAAPELPLCWGCKSPLLEVHRQLDEAQRLRCLAEDEALFGPDISNNPSTYEKASLAALHRGVDVCWLEHFTNMHDCWSWPTWRVVENIIKPATAHSRVRYVHLPGVAGAAHVGRVNIFLSHSWGGCWGDLVAAALNCLGEEDPGVGGERQIVRVYVDVFAVRQWPGNINDVVFAGVVKHCNTVLVVVSSRELERIAELSFRDISIHHLSLLSDGEKRSIPFLRIWCLAEINSACVQSKPLVIACGCYTLDTRTRTRHVFESNAPLLYHMQFLVSVAHAKALYQEDEDRILAEVKSGVGIDAVDRQVRGSICGAMVSSRCPAVRLASVGSMSALLRLLEACYRDPSQGKLLVSERVDGGTSVDDLGREALVGLVHDALCAAAASGFVDLFHLILEYNSRATALSLELPLLTLQDGDGLNVCMHAVRGGQRAIVEAVVAVCSTEDIEAKNNDQWNTLAFAAQFGCEHILRLLLARTSRVNESLSGGQVAIGIGCQNGFSLECCRLLLQAGSNVHHRDAIGYTVLRHAVTPGKNPELVKTILASGADPNSLDNWGESILQWALDGTVGSVQALLDFHPSTSNSAAVDDDVDGVVLGVAHVWEPCDVNQADINHATSALDKALGAGKENREMQELLRSAGAVTLADMMRRSGPLGSGKLLESNVQRVMKHFGVTREVAGLRLAVKAGRLDWCLEASSFPEPFDVVSTETIRQVGKKWGYGIVTRGPDWSYDDEVDGGPGCVGYLQAVNAGSIQEQKVRVTWTLSSRADSDKSTLHRAGAEGKFDLCYAPYNCVQY